MQAIGRRTPVTGIAARCGMALLALTLLAATGGAMAQASRLKIGQLTSMTGGGAALGLAANTGVRMAIKEINAAGGIMGRQIELVVGDDQSDPTAAVTEADRLVNLEKVEVMIGPQLSQYALATVPITTRAKILHLTTAGTVALTPQVGPYHFGMITFAGAQGIAAVDYAVDSLKAKSAAILIDNGGNSKDVAVYIRQHAAERNLRLTGEQEYAYRTDDVTPQVLNLRRGNPDVLLYNTVSPEDLAALLRARRDLGWDVRVSGSQSIPTFGPNAAKIVGADAFNGVTGQSNIGLTYCSGDPVGQSPYAKYVSRIKAFAPEVDGKFSPQSASYTYDLVYLLKAAVEGAHSFDTATVAAWIETNGSKLSSLSGPLSPSRTAHQLLGPRALVAVERPYETRSDGLQKRAGC